MSTPYVRALRTELIAAVAADRDRRQARQRTTLSLAATAAAVTLVLSALIALDAASAPALAIEASDDAVTITLVDASADPRAMTAELEEAGVGAVVVGQPVPAALVGRWVGGQGAALEWRQDAVVLPRSATGVVLRVGVPGRGSSLLDGSAFAPGGLLACTGLQGAPATEAGAHLAGRELPHTWRDADSAAQLVAPGPRHVVVDATLDSDGTVVLIVGDRAVRDGEQHCE